MSPELGAAQRMSWCRSTKRFGSWLALFALLIQFTVSFGHIHLDDFASATDGISSDAVSSTASQIVERPQAAPAKDSHKAPSRDNCPICASLYLTSHALAWQPPVILAPASFEILISHIISDFEFQVAQYFPFQTRGPPSV
jgi:hypothetical protein